LQEGLSCAKETVRHRTQLKIERKGRMIVVPLASLMRNVKKAKADSARAFLADLSVDTIKSLNKADLISRLCSAVDLLEIQLLLISELESKVSRLDEDHVSDLESKILLLNDDLGNRDDQIKTLEENAVQIKVCFAEHY
jgi:hypothetical protein